jgi:hypothetical protein
MMLKTFRVYAELYDGASTSAWILHAAELSASSRDNNIRDNNTAGRDNCWNRTILQHAESMQEVNAPS